MSVQPHELTADPRDRTLTDEFAEYVRLRADFERAQAEADSRKRIYEAQKNRLYNLMESMDLKSVKSETLGRVTRSVQTKARIRDGQALKAWLDDRGLSGFQSLKWAQQKLNQLTKEQLSIEGEAPDGIEPLIIPQLGFYPIKPAAGTMAVEQED